MTLKEQLKMELEKLEKEIAHLERALQHAPEGQLVTRRKGDAYYYYQRMEDENDTEVYIPNKKRGLAINLANKYYSQHRIKIAASMRNAMEKLMKKLDVQEGELDFLEKHPGVHALLKPYFMPKEERYKKWMEADYPRKMDRPEGLKYPTVIPGLMVRSKAEADIVTRLVYFEIPFRYEEELDINGTVVHTDFTCLALSNGKIFRWEHLGRCDDPNYVSHMCSRINLLSSGGWYPWKNLILTTETYDSPMDIQWVDQIIAYYLL